MKSRVFAYLLAFIFCSFTTTLSHALNISYNETVYLNDSADVHYSGYATGYNVDYLYLDNAYDPSPSPYASTEFSGSGSAVSPTLEGRSFSLGGSTSTRLGYNVRLFDDKYYETGATSLPDFQTVYDAVVPITVTYSIYLATSAETGRSTIYNDYGAIISQGSGRAEAYASAEVDIRASTANVDGRRYKVGTTLDSGPTIVGSAGDDFEFDVIETTFTDTFFAGYYGISTLLDTETFIKINGTIHHVDGYDTSAYVYANASALAFADPIFEVDPDFDLFDLIDIHFLPFDSFEQSYVFGTPPVSTPVPEPSTFLLLGGGLAGLAFMVRRKKKS